MNDYVLPEGCALILRTCNADMTSRSGFRWPESGPVECPDWDEEPRCGHGLHGLLWGSGDGWLLSWDDTAIWIVAEVDASHIVDLGGKVKFRAASVIYAGDRGTATELIARHAPSGAAIVGHRVSAGDRGAATAGDRGAATAGYRGTASVGDWGTATAGDCGYATAGNYGFASAGDRGTATAGDYGAATAGDYGAATAGDRGSASVGYYGAATAGDYGAATAGDRGSASVGYYGAATAGDYGAATAGYGGTASVGDCGTATAGEYGTASVGDWGTATAGYRGTATAGDYGSASAGYGGTIMIRYLDGRIRVRVGYIGEDGLLPNVTYRLDDDANFIRAEGGEGVSDG